MAASTITQNAVKALLYEVTTCPKPGLVDPVDPGSHKDMDVFTFIDSSLSLEPYFTFCEQAGSAFNGSDLRELFEKLRPRGIQAEKEMLAATHVINTHKGAIFSLGIFVGAEAYVQKHPDQDVFAVIRQMCRGLVKHDLGKASAAPTAGEKQYRKYGLGGARAMAEAGYPIIEDVALPFLAKSTGTTNQRLLDTLMKIATQAADSTLIKRAGSVTVVKWAQEQAQHFLDLGGAKSQAGMAFLAELNVTFKEKNYSLGGCADLLISTIFLALERGIL